MPAPLRREENLKCFASLKKPFQVFCFSNRKEFLLGEKILSFQKLILIRWEEKDIVASPEHMPIHLKVYKDTQGSCHLTFHNGLY